MGIKEIHVLYILGNLHKKKFTQGTKGAIQLLHQQRDVISILHGDGESKNNIHEDAGV